MKNADILHRCLIDDLGLHPFRIPGVEECGVAKGRLLLFAENPSREACYEITEWLSSWLTGIKSPVPTTNSSVFRVRHDGVAPYADLEDPRVFRILYQVVSFRLKVKVKVITDSAKDSYVQSFKEINRENKLYVVDKTDEILRLARAICRFVTSGRNLRPDGFVRFWSNCGVDAPRTRSRASRLLDLRPASVIRRGDHGPGAVFEKAKLDEKSFNLFSIDRVLGKWLGEWGLVALPHLTYDEATEGEGMPRPTTWGPSARSRLTLVPKTYKGPRGVFVHPARYVFVQKGIDSAIKEFVRGHEDLFRIWNPEDQQQSQDAAFTGSFNGSWGTLDLKDASDRVTLQLICYLFHRQDYLALASTRVDSVELPSGEILRLSMLSPMGDGKTFGVLSLVCIFISLAAIMRERGAVSGVRLTKHSFARSIQECSYYLRVFGDDVAVCSEYYEAVMKALPKAGLKVNATKSFVKGSFRESCGMDAYRGIDVTPLRLKVDVDDVLRDEDLEGLIEMHNRIATSFSSFRSLRVRLVQLIQSRLCNVGWTEDPSSAPSMLKTTPERVMRFITRSGLRIRWNGGLQRPECKCFCVSQELTTLTGHEPDWGQYNYSLLTGRKARGYYVRRVKAGMVASARPEDRKLVEAIAEKQYGESDSPLSAWLPIHASLIDEAISAYRKSVINWTVYDASMRIDAAVNPVYAAIGEVFRILEKEAV